MTHINAYVQEVEAAAQAAEDAKGRLNAAEDALKAHPDYKEYKAALDAAADEAKAAKSDKK